MTEPEVREAIRVAVQCAPSLRALAASWGVSPSYLSDCCNGRRCPGESILRHFGLQRVVRVTFEPIPGAEGRPGVAETIPLMQTEGIDDGE